MNERRRRQAQPRNGPDRRREPYDYDEERERWQIRRDQLIVYAGITGLAVALGGVVAGVGNTGAEAGIATVFAGVLMTPKFLQWDERRRR